MGTISFHQNLGPHTYEITAAYELDPLSGEVAFASIDEIKPDLAPESESFYDDFESESIVEAVEGALRKQQNQSKR
jgi:hypothetical protein